MDGGSIFFYITTKDGAAHQVGNIGNVYLVIDNAYFESPYAWLSTWDDAYGSGDSVVPNGFFERRGGAVKWFDYFDSPDEMNWNDRLEINIPDFPDVTFRCNPYRMEAVTEKDIVPLYDGMPVWSAYFCDLTGDGLPELCSTVSFGSGLIDHRIIVYDYAMGVSYELEDRGFHDYVLHMQDDRLIVTEQERITGKVNVGVPVIEDGELLFQYLREEPRQGISDSAVRTAPPALTASARQSSVEALRGAYSWRYDSGGGLMVDIEADSAHPLMLRGQLPALLCYPDAISSTKPNEVVLHFEEEPDEVQVYCWSDAHWGDYSAESETIPVSKSGAYSFELKEGGFIYNVSAVWSRPDRYGGRADYMFYGSYRIPTEIGSMTYGSFSFAEVLANTPEGTPGAKYDGFVNTDAISMNGFLDAAERAKAEATVDYDQYRVSYDDAANVWAVHFSKSGVLGGDETVYLGGDGMTRLIVYGE